MQPDYDPFKHSDHGLGRGRAITSLILGSLAFFPIPVLNVLFAIASLGLIISAKNADYKGLLSTLAAIISVLAVMFSLGVTLLFFGVLGLASSLIGWLLSFF